MAPPEANIEMVVLARNFPNDCIDFSMPGGSARDETALAILRSKYQRANIVEVHRQGPAITPSLRRTNWRRMREIPRRAKPWLCYISKHKGSPGEGGGGELSMGSNIVTSLAPGEPL
jgi:hypothetical protein